MRVGLTGGIGTGKSAVAKLFARHAVPVFDADEIGHRLIAPGQPAYREILATFGFDVVGDNGEIDRKKLRERIFANPAERARLEAVLHPRIRAEMDWMSRAIKDPYCLFVIPLLIETGQYRDVDRVLVVDAPEEIQVQRVVSRSGLLPDEVRSIIAAQATRADRLKRADDVIVNDKDISQLEQAVDQLHAKYSALARRPT